MQERYLNKREDSLSLSELSKGGNNSVEGVAGVDKWRKGSASPGELSHDSGIHSVFHSERRSDVTHFELSVFESIFVSGSFYCFQDWHLSYISNISNHFQVLQVASKVGQVQEEVVSGGNFHFLHLFSLVADFLDTSLNAVLLLHELLVLGLQLVNNTIGVDLFLPIIPVYFL